MNQQSSRPVFEDTMGYKDVPKSAQDLLDQNAWPTWNISWSLAVNTVSPEMKEAISALTATLEFEVANFDAESTPLVLRKH